MGGDFGGWHAQCKRGGNPLKTMKAFLNFLSLGLVIGGSAAAVAEVSGVVLPAVINVPYVVAAFAVAGVLAVMAGDFGRKPGLSLALTAHPGAKPTPGRLVRPHAYSIRRGVEAARLAQPPKVLAFRRTPHVRYERAA